MSGSCVLTQQPGGAQSSGSLVVLDGIRSIQQWREGLSYARGSTAKMWAALLRERRVHCQGLKPERLSFKVGVCACACARACACVCRGLIRCHRELLTLAMFLGYWTPNKAETICKGSASLCKETQITSIYGIWSPFIWKNFPGKTIIHIVKYTAVARLTVVNCN